MKVGDLVRYIYFSSPAKKASSTSVGIIVGEADFYEELEKTFLVAYTHRGAISEIWTSEVRLEVLNSS